MEEYYVPTDIPERGEEYVSADILERGEEYVPTELPEQGEGYVSTDLPETEDYDLTDPEDIEDIEDAGSDAGQYPFEDVRVYEFAVSGQAKQPYRVSFHQELGKGGQARVYPCVCEADGREYVVKLYETGKIRQDKLLPVLHTLEKEKSPYVTNVLGHGDCQIDGQAYHYVLMPRYQKLKLELEYFKFHNNQDYIKRLVKFVEEVNEGLRFLHNNKILHGDIKPDNIMYAPDTMHYLLIDLGASVLTDHGETMTAAGATQKYMPPFTSGTYRTNEQGNYHSFGIVLAELIDGVYPKEEAKLKRRTGAGLIQIGSYYYIPDTIPEWLKNLLSGLLYCDTVNPEWKSYVWTAEKVRHWCDLMRRRNMLAAARDNKVPERKMVSPAEQMAFKFQQPVYLPLGPDGRDEPVDSLGRLAQLASGNWRQGVEIFLNLDEYFPEQKVTRDILRIMRRYTDRMKRINPGSGELYDGVFFEFLYEYMPDKKAFIWNRMPEVKDLQSFAMRLISTLDTMEKSGYALGEWWKNSKDNTQKMSTRFAEIFYNKVLSVYLSKSGYYDEEIKALCDETEKYFEGRPQQLSLEKASDLYLMAYKILDHTEYEVETDIIFRDYEAFLRDFSALAYDPKNVSKTRRIWEKITDGTNYRPAFHAWMRMHLGKKAGSITHGIKSESANKGKGKKT